MTDAELYDVASRVLRDWQDVEACRAGSPELDRHMSLAVYVARYTDPAPIAECLERIAGERGGRHVADVPFGAPYATFGLVTVWEDSKAMVGVGVNDYAARVPNITTAGELHRLLDTMGVTP